jgi:hypothetical protein
MVNLYMAAQKSAFEEEIQERRTRWQRENADHDRQVREETEALKKQRQREKEDYEYAFAREKEQRRNALEDELQALEKEIAERRSNFESDKALMEARFDGEKNVLLGKIEALEKIAAAQSTQIGDLSKRTELAYEKVQDIANRAVTASRRDVYMPPPVQHSGVAVRDDKQG